jgi:hypothetical protein
VATVVKQNETETVNTGGEVVFSGEGEEDGRRR